MKKYPILATCVCLVAVMTAVIVGCKKEKNENADNQNERIPIAIYDKNAGVLTTLVDVESINQKIKDECITKEYADRYIMESYSVRDSMPLNSKIHAEVEISIIDTETESSYTFWLMECFTTKIVKEQTVEYYYSDDCYSERFTIQYSEGGRYYFLDIEGNTISEYEVSQEAYFAQRQPKILLGCRRVSDCHECHKAGSAYYAYCSCVDPNSGHCVEDNSIFADILIGIGTSLSVSLLLFFIL